MKTENTTENKSAFFGLYLNQYVAKETKFPKSPTIRPYNVLGIDATSFYHLELKTLESISDEDAIEVAKISIGIRKRFIGIDITKTYDRKFGFSFWLNHEEEFAIDFRLFYDIRLICLDRGTLPNEFIHNHLQIIDYLRSKGYALPFLDLSVQDLIDYGWIKLK